MNKLKIGVVFGGTSTEHDVSVVSGTSILKNLDREKYDIFPIYINQEGKWFQYTKALDKVEILRIGDIITEVKEIQNPIEFLKKF